MIGFCKNPFGAAVMLDAREPTSIQDYRLLSLRLIDIAMRDSDELRATFRKPPHSRPPCSRNTIEFKEKLKVKSRFLSLPQIIRRIHMLEGCRSCACSGSYAAFPSKRRRGPTTSTELIPRHAIARATCQHFVAAPIFWRPRGRPQSQTIRPSAGLLSFFLPPEERSRSQTWRPRFCA